jgi:hypothetical protein
VGEAALYTNQIETFMKVYRLPGKNLYTSPSNDLIEDVVTWAMNRHRSAVTIMPPDITWKIEKCSMEMKTASTIQKKERSSMLYMSVTGVQLSVSISQSSSNMGLHQQPKANSSTASSAMNMIQNQRRGFASLTGALVQFRLVAKQFTFALAIPPLTKSSSISTKSASAFNTSTESNTMASTHNNNNNNNMDYRQEPFENHPSLSDSQLANQTTTISTTETSATTSATATTMDGLAPVTATSNNRSTTVHTVLGIAGKPLPMKYPKTPENPASIVASSAPQTAMKSTTTVTGPYNIHTPIDDLHTLKSTNVLSVPATVIKKMDSTTIDLDEEEDATIPFELREIIVSAPTENVFIFCVILDLDDKGEGAGDIQIGFGSLRMDYSKRVIAAMLFPYFTETIEKIRKHASNISMASSLLSEKMVIIDWQEKMPYISLVCDPPVSIIDRWLQQAKQQAKQQQQQHHQKANQNTHNGHHHHHHHPHTKNGHSSNNTLNNNDQDILRTVLIDDGVLNQSINSNESPHQSHYQFSQHDHHHDDSDEDNDHEDDDSSPGASQSEPHVVKMDEPFFDEHDIINEDEEEYPAHSSNNNTNETLLEQRKRRREAIVFNKNIMQWLGTMEACLPRVLSVCIRSSPIVIQSIESFVIRDLVYAKIHHVLDR